MNHNNANEEADFSDNDNFDVRMPRANGEETAEQRLNVLQSQKLLKDNEMLTNRKIRVRMMLLKQL